MLIITMTTYVSFAANLGIRANRASNNSAQVIISVHDDQKFRCKWLIVKLFLAKNVGFNYGLVAVAVVD